MSGLKLLASKIKKRINKLIKLYKTQDPQNPIIEEKDIMVSVSFLNYILLLIENLEYINIKDKIIEKIITLIILIEIYQRKLPNYIKINIINEIINNIIYIRILIEELIVDDYELENEEYYEEKTNLMKF